MVGVSPEFVRVNPGTVATPLVKVWSPFAGFVGAVSFGELFAVQVQVIL